MNGQLPKRSATIYIHYTMNFRMLCDQDRTNSRTLLRILLNRLSKVADSEVSVGQLGFRKGVGTKYGIFNLRINRMNITKVPLRRASVDYKKAFDPVIHNKS